MRFNTVVIALWPHLDQKAREDLYSGQRSWERYLNDECDIAYHQFFGGTEAPIAAGSCYVSLTRARVQELTGMLASYTQG